MRIIIISLLLLLGACTKANTCYESEKRWNDPFGKKFMKLIFEHEGDLYAIQADSDDDFHYFYGSPTRLGVNDKLLYLAAYDRADCPSPMMLKDYTFEQYKEWGILESVGKAMGLAE